MVDCYVGLTDSIYWPTFVIAVVAAIIASQAMISGAFAIISQSLSLGCFPRAKIIHTSAKYEGQVYIPEVNYILMIACVLVTWGFKSTTKIGNAYGNRDFYAFEFRIEVHSNQGWICSMTYLDSSSKFLLFNCSFYLEHWFWQLRIIS